MPRYAVLVSVVIAACSVELAEPDRSSPFTQIGGASGNGGSGGGGEEGGIFGGGGGPAGTGAGGFGGVGGVNDGSTGDRCTDCNYANCPEYAQCAQTPDCVNLGNCIANCNDPNCQVSCLNTYNAVYNLYFAALSCQDLICGAQCDDPVCNSCEQTNCMAQKISCVGNSECLGYWFCITTCVEAACFQQCEGLWDGQPQYFDYVDCLEQFCTGVCI